jgi:altronate dehydratase small subunit
MASLIRLSVKDNVATAGRNIAAGEELEVEGLTVRALDPIPFAHKIALQRIEAGERVVKYGVPVGRARIGIAAGRHVHVHNIRSDYVNNAVDNYDAAEAGGARS